MARNVTKLERPGDIPTKIGKYVIINKIGKGIKVVGWSSGGEATEDVIEALEIENNRIVAVQWHPELLPGADPIFSWLINQANK